MTNLTVCEHKQQGCRTPFVRGTQYRVWIFGEHYDHRTLGGAQARWRGMSRYEQEAAIIQDLDGNRQPKR